MITEIDGPPRAYFEVYGEANVCNSPGPIVVSAERPTGEKVMLRFVYKTIYANSEDRLREFIQKMKDALEKEAGEDKGIIFWRRRVTSWEGTSSWSCRLATSPPIPESWWAQFPFSQSTSQYHLD